MSIALPILPNNANFITELLQDQHSLTAVERFSELHDLGSHLHGGNAQSRYYQNLLPSSPPRPGFQFAFEVDLDKCSGCKACVVACHTMNGLEDDEVWRKVGTTTTPGPLGMIQHVTTACHHCEEPGCLLGCPVKAYDKDPVTGIVRHLDDQCIGCKYCTMMCPYEVPQYSERLGIVRKCDMCHQRLSAGEAPACVQGCPNEAIAIREVAVGETAFAFEERLAPGAPESSITRPTTIYKSSQNDEFAGSIPQDARIDSPAESHWPLAIMLVLTQASVGLLLAERLFASAEVLLGATPSIGMTRASSALSLVLAMVGLNLASLHLGQPLRAWRVFLGLRTSWLSREAVVLGKYVGLLTVATALLWMPLYETYLPARVLDLKSYLPVWAAKAALGSALLVGIAGLASSAMIYIATKRKLWRMSRTMPRFLLSGCVTGAACLLPIVALSFESPFKYNTFAWATVALITVKLAMDLQLCVSRKSSSDEDKRSQRLTMGPMRRMLSYRVATGITAVLFVPASMLALFAGSGIAAFAFATVGAMLLLAGEFAERILYFTTVVYDRMPGTLR